MTLDEAIDHCEQKVRELGTCDCSNDHKQLAQWLKELKLYRNKYGSIIWKI